MLDKDIDKKDILEITDLQETTDLQDKDEKEDEQVQLVEQNPGGTDPTDPIDPIDPGEDAREDEPLIKEVQILNFIITHSQQIDGPPEKTEEKTPNKKRFTVPESHQPEEVLPL